MSARGFIANNFWIKLLALVLAVMIWSIVNTLQQGGRIERPSGLSQKPHTFYRLPVTVLQSAGDVRAFRFTPATVEVTVGGPSSVMEQLSSSDLEVFVNLTGVMDANGLMQKVHVYHPPQVNILKISPPDVQVELVKP